MELQGLNVNVDKTFKQSQAHNKCVSIVSAVVKNSVLLSSYTFSCPAKRELREGRDYVLSNLLAQHPAQVSLYNRRERN